MKLRLMAFALLLATNLSAQYYYKDIIGSRESSALINVYKNAGVNAVSVTSYDATNTRIEDFLVAQTFSKAHASLRTVTQQGITNQTILTSYADAQGRVIKTVDSSATLTSTTEYGYDADGRLTTVKSTSADSGRRFHETEVHHWQYSDGQPARMLRIINAADTTIVTFKVDGGNVAEEWSTRRGVASAPVYYYYNKQNELTDIVRFNAKVNRLLPEYMFEYGEGRIIQKITVPANSSDYLIWRYQYNADGLKIKEAIYDRQKTLTGKIEYRYERG